MQDTGGFVSRLREAYKLALDQRHRDVIKMIQDRMLWLAAQNGYAGALPVDAHINGKAVLTCEIDRALEAIRSDELDVFYNSSTRLLFWTLK